MRSVRALLRGLCVVACGSTLCATRAADVTTLADNFSNGAVNDSDSAVGFWSQALAGAAGSYNAVSESGGRLFVTAGGNNDNAYSGASLYSSALSSDFNFFAGARTIRGRGIGFAQVTGAPAWDRMVLRIAFVSSGTDTYGADDAVLIKGIGTSVVDLRYKVNTPNNSDGTLLEQVNLRATDGNNHWNGFELTLAPGSAANTVDYAFTAVGVNSSVTRYGTFALAVANWNGAGGDARLVVWTQEGNITGNTAFRLQLDHLMASRPVVDPKSVVSLDVNGFFAGQTSADGGSDHIRFFGGPGVLGGGFWNQSPSTSGGGTQTFAALRASDGSASSVQVAITSVYNGWAQASPVAAFGQDLMRDYLYLNHTDGADTSTITLSGLETMGGYVRGSTAFNVALLASNRGNNDSSAFTLGGTTKTVGLDDTTSATQFVEGSDYVVFPNAVDADGTIAITWTQGTAIGSQAAYSSLNGIQVQCVPQQGTVFIVR